MWTILLVAFINVFDNTVSFTMVYAEIVCKYTRNASLLPSQTRSLLSSFSAALLIRRYWWPMHRSNTLVQHVRGTRGGGISQSCTPTINPIISFVEEYSFVFWQVEMQVIFFVFDWNVNICSVSFNTTKELAPCFDDFRWSTEKYCCSWFASPFLIPFYLLHNKCIWKRGL